MVTTEAAEPGEMRKMLKPLVEKRRRDRINRSLEELRLLLLQRTHCQVRAEIAEARTSQTCYMMGFRECLLGLAAFIQQAHPSVQSHLLDTLHLYLTSKPEPQVQDWSYPGFSPSPSWEGSSPRTPEAFCSPQKKLEEPLRSPDSPSSSTGQLGSQQRDTHQSAGSTKRMPPPPAFFWRPWP
nr:transcription factor HES-7 [Pogona vitticeps]